MTLPHVIELDATTPVDAQALLEQGNVLMLSAGVVPLPSADDLALLRNELPQALRLKNISYHPGSGMLSGMRAGGSLKEQTRRILAEHNRTVVALLEKWLPDYAARWHVGKVNFRPLEEKGRTLSRHASNEYLHVDAFASGATYGARILRFFTNIHEEQARVWRSGGLFADLLAQFGESANMPRGPAAVRPGIGDHFYTTVLGALQHVGWRDSRLAGSSPYDRAMRRFHNFLKDNDAFQRDTEHQAVMRFPPGSSWMVLTDGVSHAVVEGRHALVNTFYVPLTACALPDAAPFNLLQAPAP